ncbi:hypothetical protein M404DRAFT_1007610, partial [Pisolithus tinctorius Marx 270]
MILLAMHGPPIVLVLAAKAYDFDGSTNKSASQYSYGACCRRLFSQPCESGIMTAMPISDGNGKSRQRRCREMLATTLPSAV